MVTAAGTAAGQPAFASVTGVIEPFEYTGWHASTTYDDAGDELLRIRYEGLSGFDEVLEIHFTEAAWADVKDALVLPQGDWDQDWRPDDYKHKRLYRRTHTDELGTRCECFVAYDHENGTALVVGRHVGPSGAVPATAAAPAFRVREGDRVVDMQPAPEDE